MSPAEAFGPAVMTTLLTMGLSAAAGYGLYRAVRVSKPGKPTDHARNWGGWGLFLAAVALLPRFFRDPDVNALAAWVLMAVVTGALGYAAGWVYGTILRRRRGFTAAGSSTASGAIPKEELPDYQIIAGEEPLQPSPRNTAPPQLHTSRPAPLTAAQGPVGLGGWLLLLVVVLMLLWPLLNAVQIALPIWIAEQDYPELATYPGWTTFKTATLWLFLGFAAISFWGGLGLARDRTWSVVRRAIVVLWIVGPIALIVLGSALPLFIFGEVGASTEEILGNLAKALILSVVWTAYLVKSRRVRNTFSRAIDEPGLGRRATLDGSPDNLIAGEILSKAREEPSSPGSTTRSGVVQRGDVYLVVALVAGGLVIVGLASLDGEPTETVTPGASVEAKVPDSSDCAWDVSSAWKPAGEAASSADPGSGAARISRGDNGAGPAAPADRAGAPLTSSDIARMQGMLSQLGYRLGPADGVAGPRTRQAIMDFERSLGWAATGEPSLLLLSRLESQVRRDPPIPTYRYDAAKGAWVRSDQ